MCRIADQDRPPTVPAGRRLEGVHRRQAERGRVGGLDELPGGDRVLGERLEQRFPQRPCRHRFEGRTVGLRAGGEVGEPQDASALRSDEAEEGALAEHHLERRRVGLEVDAARDSADSEQPRVLGTGSPGVEALAGGGPDAVRADQESAALLAAIREPGHDAVGRLLEIDQPLSVDDMDASLACLVVEGAVEGGALNRGGGGAVGEANARLEEPEELARPAGEHHPFRAESRGDDRAMGVDGLERVEAVRGHREERADPVRRGGAGLEHRALDPDALERHAHHGAGDPAPDHQRPSVPLAIALHSLPPFSRCIALWS